MKILGIECSGIKIPNYIQPREYSRGGGTDGTLYYSTRMAILTCSTSSTIATSCGSTPTTAGLTTSGMLTTASSSCLATLSFLSRYSAGEFCFVSCPFQPPSIFPISSNCRDRAIYFLLSIDLVSQRTIKRSLNVSSFLIAILT